MDEYPQAAPTTHAEPTAASAPVPETLDAVRDILFGGQMRAVDARLQAMEERIMREQSALRVELSRRLADVDGFAREELRLVSERFAAERARSSNDTHVLGAEVSEALRAMEQRHAQLADATSQADAEIREQLLMHARATASELSSTREGLVADLSGSHAELMSRKTDRAALAQLFTDIARRLGDAAQNTGARD